MAPKILELSNVSTFRGTHRVFAGLNLSVAVGDNTAIVGPNGAGKSTLLKLIAREIYPSEGSVKVFERERWNVWELRRKLGLVSADLQTTYSANATGWTVVLSGFYSSNDIQRNQSFDSKMLAAAKSMVYHLGIEKLVERPFAKMSTGQQRRCLLARALVHQPEALILDEPTSGLDMTAQFQYFATMRQLMKAGRTLVLVTHHIDEILPEIQSVVLMKDGKVIMHDKKESVLTDGNLSEAFCTSIQVISRNGYYHAIPGAPTEQIAKP